MSATADTVSHYRELLEITRMITSSLDLDVVLATVARQAAALLRGEAAALLLLEGGALRVAAAYHVPDAVLRVAVPLGPGLMAKIRDIGRVAGLASCVGVPLVLRGETIGALAAYRRGDVAAAAEDEDLLSALADQASVALDNARIYRDLQARTEALRESEERFRALANGTPVIIWVTDTSGKIQFVNRAYLEFFGTSPEAGEPEGWMQWVHPEDRAAYIAESLAALRERRSFRAQARFRRADGQWRWLESYGQPRLTPSGECIGYAASSPDVTEQRQLAREQRLLAEVSAILATTIDYEETLRNLARLVIGELADVCIVEAVEEGGRIRRLQVAHRDPAKAGVAEELQRIPLDVRRPHLSSSVLETRRPLLMAEIPPEYLSSIAIDEKHHELLRALGLVSLISLPLLAHGQLVGSMLIGSVTADRRYGQEDLRLAEELARRAALAVANAALYRTALRATQARDDLLGIVAHDLRSPLGTVLMQVSLLQRTPRGQEPEILKIAAGIERGAFRMKRLIQDLLDVTRIETGRLVLDQVPVSAGQVVDESVAAHEPLAGQASIALLAEAAADLPAVWADRDRLLQAFDNLIGNAIKFTAPGGRITVGARVRDAEVLFWVADTGPGILPEHLPHVFERSWRPPQPDRRGAGLGLAIVKGIVEAHGGRVWVESTPGEGCTFFFTVPRAPPGEREAGGDCAFMLESGSRRPHPT